MIKNIPTHLSTEQCTFEVPVVENNSTILDAPTDIFFLYRVASYYYALTGCVVCIAVGIVVSLLTDHGGHVDKRLLSPLVHRWLPEDAGKDDYFSIDKANRIVTSLDLQNLQDANKNVSKV